MDAEQGQVEEGLGHEVAVGDGVEGVLEAAGEAEVGGHAVGVERQRRAGQRPGPEGAHVEADDGVQQPVDVAGEGPAVGQEVVGEQHRLGPLQVGVARAGRRRRPRRPGAAAPPGGRSPPRRRASSSRRVYSRRSVATWSLRLRPVWSLAPTSPAISVTRRSTAVWMSSSPAWKTKIPEASSSSTRSRAASEDGRPRPSSRTPARPRPRTWAREPVEVVGGQAPVEGQADGEGHDLVGRPAQPALPEGHESAPAGPLAVHRSSARRGPPWRAAHVATPRPHSRTKPSASAWWKVSVAS